MHWESVEMVVRIRFEGFYLNRWIVSYAHFLHQFRYPFAFSHFVSFDNVRQMFGQFLLLFRLFEQMNFGLYVFLFQLVELLSVYNRNWKLFEN